MSYPNPSPAPCCPRTQCCPSLTTAYPSLLISERKSVAMRDLYMKSGQGFLLVFSITSPSSLTELVSLRDEIVRVKDDENAPMVVVGNKADLEESRAVERARGFSLSQKWGAPYYESSARTRSKLPLMSRCRCRCRCRGTWASLRDVSLECFHVGQERVDWSERG